MTSLAATFRDRAAPFGNWVLAAAASLHETIFNSEVNQITRRRWLPFSSTLVLPGLNVDEGLGIDDPEKIKGRDFVFRARDRDLKGAIFDLASLPKVDFAGAHLQGASLIGAQLQGASLEGAQLQGAVLAFAQLQGASLGCVELLHGQKCAQLQGASLDEAQLQGASLDEAQLQGASLDEAQLQGALLDVAQLQGASLHEAQLQGASLQGAVLDATDLSDVYLWRADHTPPPSVSAVRMSGADKIWLPQWRDSHGHEQPWNDEAFQALRTTIEPLPPGPFREQALKRIQNSRLFEHGRDALLLRSQGVACAAAQATARGRGVAKGAGGAQRRRDGL